MKFEISIIIPTYNRARLLDLTLKSLEKTIFNFGNFEVIIVDDGSTDDTKFIVEKYKKTINLKYFFQEKDGFRVAKARNKGAFEANSDILIFLDCGILVPTYFINEHYKIHLKQKNTALLGYVAGYDDYNKEKDKILNLLNLDDIDSSITKFLENNLFDMREVLYEKHGDDLSKWAAPWCICWTGNFSLRKDIFFKCGGFDENFKTWGGEDTDFAINLYLNNIKIILNRKAIGIHYPHEKEKIIISEQEMRERTREKRLYMYQKYGLNDILVWANCETFELNDKLTKTSKK